MTDLESNLRVLAQEFAAAVARIVKTATLQAVAEVLEDCARSESVKQVAAPEGDHSFPHEPDPSDSDRRTIAKPVRPPLPRNREQTLSREADRVLFYLRARPGQRAETVRVALGLEREDLLNAIQQLLACQKITEVGERRATKYWPA